MTEEESQTTKLLAFNQGFYNLFLALGAFAGVALIAADRVDQGLPIVVFACLSMLAAAIVLAASSPKMIRGAIIQGAFPLVALVLAG